MADRVSRTVLKYISDVSDLRVAENALAALGNKQAQLNVRLREFEDNANRASRATRTLASGQSAAARATTGGGQSRGQSRAERLDRIGSFGSQFFGGVGAGELGNVAGLVGDLSGAVGSLGPVAVGTTAIMAGLAIIMAQYNRVLEEGRRRLATALAAQDAYFAALQANTTDQVREQADLLERQRVFLEAQANETRAAIEAARQEANNMQGIEGVIARGAVAFGGALGTLEERLRAQEDAVQANIDTHTRLTQALQEGAFAANDAAAAVERSGQALNTSIVEGLREAQEAARFALETRRLTAEQAQQRLESLRLERESIQSALESMRAFRDSSEEARQAFEGMEEQVGIITNQILQLEERQRAARLEEARAAGKVRRQRNIEDTKQQLEQETAILNRIQELRTSAQDETQKVLTEASARETEIIRDAALRRADVLYQAGREEIKAALTQARERAKIERDFGRALTSAVARRDVLAAIEAKRQRNDNLSDLKDSAAAEQAQRRMQLQDQLRDISNNQREQVLRVREGARAQIATIRERLNAELQGQRSLLNVAASYAQSRAALEARGYQASLSSAALFAQSLAGLFQNLASNAVPKTTGRQTTNNYIVNGRASDSRTYTRNMRMVLEQY